jgi:predicted NUDIX family NTP pyrophosphohydrolase
MSKLSAGLLIFRLRAGLEVLLVHPGGPFFRSKDDGVWTVPKGEVEKGEEPLATARRELREETGLVAPETGFIPLGEVRQRGGKRVVAWAFEGDVDPAAIESESFELEWPPHSGRRQRFPEVDRADFFRAAQARVKLNEAQVAFIDRLEQTLEQR